MAARAEIIAQRVGQDGAMAGTDLVRQASDELYSLDPDTFVDRRRELADEARRAGQPVAAKEIAALRKPTRSAWTLNVLARAEPGLIDEVLAVGEQMRDAERRLDGGRLRELSKQRRQLVNTLARKAFAASLQASPSAALREEVDNTLSAAFADPELADLVRSGTMLRAAQWDGFGSGSRPDLTLVPPPSRAAAKKPDAKTPGRKRDPNAPAKKPDAKATAAQTRAAERALEGERRARRREQIAAAKKQVAEARRELAAAESTERERRDRLRELKDQVAQMQHALGEARLHAGRAKSELRKAEQALDRAER
ncbi:MAG TPA: hypothetical protein VE441_11340 [Mycobacterium sp.]|nr:hypothetical protein [Mycobacterium sp.]